MEPWGRPECKGYKFLIFSLFHERKSINISAGLPAGWLGEHPQSWEIQRRKSALEQMAAEEHASVTFYTSVGFALQKPLAFPYNVTIFLVRFTAHLPWIVSERHSRIANSINQGSEGLLQNTSITRALPCLTRGDELSTR